MPDILRTGMRVVLQLLYLTTAFLHANGEECRNGWIRHGNSCYMFSRDTENWVIARATCATSGAKLVEIDDVTEDRFIQGWVDQLNSSFWAGGSDLEINGEWVWTSTNEPMTYTNWNPGEPSDFHHTVAEDCLELSANKAWKDSECKVGHRYICEKETSMPNAHNCRSGWIRYENSCYFFSRDTETWDTAKATCGIFGTKLVDIDDVHEDHFLQNWVYSLSESYMYYYTGANDREQEGQWIWDSTNEPLQYHNWRPNEPNNMDQENCMGLYTHFNKWNDIPCGGTWHFICEQKLS